MVSFFYKLRAVEQFLQSECGAEGNFHDEVKIKRAVFAELKEFIIGCSWTKSKSTKFIVDNRNVTSSKELADIYEKNDPQRKTKAAATFRVQRANVSKILYSMFGETFDLVLMNGTRNEIEKLRTRILILNDMNRNTYEFISKGVISLIQTIPEMETEELYCVEDCQKELIYLSTLSYSYIQRCLKDLDTNKLKYLCEVLVQDSVVTSDHYHRINEEKVKILNLFRILPVQMKQVNRNTYQEGNSKIWEKDKQGEEVQALQSEIKKLRLEKESLSKLVSTAEQRIEELEKQLFYNDMDWEEIFRGQ